MDNYIPFKQYKRDGEVLDIHVPADPDVCERAKALLSHGWEFKCEVMSNLFCMFSAWSMHEDGVHHSKVDKIASNDDRDIRNCIRDMINEAAECGNV